MKALILTVSRAVIDWFNAPAINEERPCADCPHFQADSDRGHVRSIAVEVLLEQLAKPDSEVVKALRASFSDGPLARVVSRAAAGRTSTSR